MFASTVQFEMDATDVVTVTDLFRAVYDGDLRGVEAALASGTVDVNDRLGVVPVLACALFSDETSDEVKMEMLRSLIEDHGADPNAATLFEHLSSTVPLHIVATKQSMYIDLLVAHGAHVDCVENEALMCAVDGGPPDCILALLRHGASLDPRNSGGVDALDVARRRYEAQPAWENYCLINFLTEVRAAGSWTRYVREPVAALLALRYLCLAGRAMAPPHFLRLFGAAPIPNAGKARTRARRVAAATPLPTEVFAHILGFWNRRVLL